jgi:hypothetical protein
MVDGITAESSVPAGQNLETLARFLFEGNDDVVVMHDHQGRIQDANEAACHRIREPSPCSSNPGRHRSESRPAHGGRIEDTINPCDWTTFRISLPLQPDEKENEPR